MRGVTRTRERNLMDGKSWRQASDHWDGERERPPGPVTNLVDVEMGNQEGVATRVSCRVSSLYLTDSSESRHDPTTS